MALSLTATARTVEVVNYSDDIQTDTTSHHVQSATLDRVLTVPEDMINLAEDYDKNPMKYPYPSKYKLNKHFALRIGYDQNTNEVRLTVADTTFTNLDEFAQFHKIIQMHDGGPVRIPDGNTPMGIIDDVNMALDGYRTDPLMETIINPKDRTFNRDSVLFIALNKEGYIIVDPPAEMVDLTQLKSEVKKFIKSNGGYILFRYNRATTYKDYAIVDAAITPIYDEVRNEYAQEQYGKPFKELNADQQDAIFKRTPGQIFHLCTKTAY